MQDTALNSAPRIFANAPRQSACADWLLGVAAAIEQARADWSNDGVALFRCGALFTAVRIPADIVHAAAGSSAPDDVADALSALGGPVFFHPRGERFYALTDPQASWSPSLDAEALAPDTYIGVPALDRTEPDEELSAYWAVPLVDPGELCDAGAVVKLAAVGREVLDRGRKNGGPAGD